MDKKIGIISNKLSDKEYFLDIINYSYLYPSIPLNLTPCDFEYNIDFIMTSQPAIYYKPDVFTYDNFKNLLQNYHQHYRHH